MASLFFTISRKEYLLMKCRDIYLSALALIGEPTDNTGTADYAQRAVGLLKIVFAKYAPLSDALGETSVKENLPQIENLDNDYPLDSKLAGICAEALASMLILDKSPDISEILEKRIKEDIERVSKTVVEIGTTKEVYN